MNIKGLIFDFDGTLATASTLDFVTLNRKLAEDARQMGYSWPEEGYILERVHQLGVEVAIKEGAQRAKAIGNRLLQLIIDEEIKAARHSRLLDCTMDVLQQAERLKLKTAIVSRNCAPAIVAVFPQADKYVFLPRDAVAWVKPDPRHFIHAAQLMDLTASQCAAIGDHPMDMQGADKAGCLPIGVKSGLADEADLLASGARQVLQDIGQLIPWLQQQNMLDISWPGSKF